MLKNNQQLYLMSIKRSENYVYFQNKATHYHNIQVAKTKIQNHLHTSIRNTIDHSQRMYDRDFPYLKKYQIDQENKNFADRLLSINGYLKKQANRIGTYSRFNKFERNFRKLNSYKDEQQRKIMLENEKIKRKIESTRAKVGSHSVWQAEYKDNDKFKKISRRYEDNQKSKIQLVIQKQRYLPDHYLKFIQQLSHSNSDKSIEKYAKIQGSRTSRNQSKTYRIDPQKMFVLPSLQNQSTSKQKKDQTLKQSNHIVQPQTST